MGGAPALQLAAAEAQESIRRERKTCVAAYPTSVSDGLLFVWMDNSPEGLLLSAQTPPFKSNTPSPLEWIMVGGSS